MLDLSHVNALITPLPPIATPGKAAGTRRLTGGVVGASPARTPQTPQQPPQPAGAAAAVQVCYMPHTVVCAGTVPCPLFHGRHTLCHAAPCFHTVLHDGARCN